MFKLVIVPGVLAGAAWLQAVSALAAPSAAQAERGATTFAAACSLCHGVDMSGGPGAPSLKGPEFTFSWRGKPVSELFDYVKTKMPPGMAGSLSDEDYASVVAAILQSNGAAPGAELPADSAALKALTIGPPP